MGGRHDQITHAITEDGRKSLGTTRTEPHPRMKSCIADRVERPAATAPACRSRESCPQMSQVDTPRRSGEARRHRGPQATTRRRDDATKRRREWAWVACSPAPLPRGAAAPAVFGHRPTHLRPSVPSVGASHATPPGSSPVRWDLQRGRRWRTSPGGHPQMTRMDTDEDAGGIRQPGAPFVVATLSRPPASSAVAIFRSLAPRRVARM
jgi:hypothetical protein